MRHFATILFLGTLIGCGGGGDEGEAESEAEAEGEAEAEAEAEAESESESDAGVDGCVDRDEDGYGEGCAKGPDCSDTDDDVHPGAIEMCNGEDDDCDGGTDEPDAAPPCALLVGVCEGALRVCVGVVWEDCGADAYGDDYEAIETSCDGLDNDCNGMIDESCECTPGEEQPCGTDAGACVAGAQTCLASGFRGVCVGATTPSIEVCDGVDNDCDGDIDEELPTPGCALVMGVCAGVEPACGGAGGWLACDYGAAYEAAESLCDSQDNDCDGAIDEGCECELDQTQDCGSDVGACSIGAQSCPSGAWGGCVGAVGPADTEECNGVDDDCDGLTDEGLAGALCPLGEGVCAGARDACRGEDGWSDCDAATYGLLYQLEETMCDGLDNDCDTEIDEGCACEGGAQQICGVDDGACGQGLQTCAAGVWGACAGLVGPVTEDCDAIDNNCDGVIDEGLEPPLCDEDALGVCATMVKECGGVAGWLDCDLSTDPEDDAMCDGLDNDCDGETDEECAAAPVVALAGDQVQPAIYAHWVTYADNRGGDWDIYVYDMQEGVETRVTDSALDDSAPDIYGDLVVWQRCDPAAEPVQCDVIGYDLAAGVETSIAASGADEITPRVFRDVVVFSSNAEGDYDIYRYDWDTAATEKVADKPGADDLAPDVMGSFIAYQSNVSGNWDVYVVGSDAPMSADTTNAQTGPSLDWTRLYFTDARGGFDDDPESDWDVYVVDPAVGSSSEIMLTPEGWGQAGGAAHSSVVPWTDRRNGTADVFVGIPSGGSIMELALGLGPGDQIAPAAYGATVVWQGDQAGGFDIFGAVISTSWDPPGEGEVTIAEVLFDPVLGLPEDEFVEILNITDLTSPPGRPVDLAGLTLHDGTPTNGSTHIFPADTVLGVRQAIVIYGGAVPSIGHGGAIVQISNGAASCHLCLTNAGDTVSLRDGAATIATMTYTGQAASFNQSIVQTNEGSAAAYTPHTTHPESGGAVASPGRNTSGYAY